MSCPSLPVSLLVIGSLSGACFAQQNTVLRLPSIPSAVEVPHTAIQNAPIDGRAMTVEFWIKYESGPARVVSKRGCSFGGFTVHCDPHPDGGVIHLELGTTLVELDWFCGTIPTNEWHHIAFAWDHAARRLDYILDGVLTNSTTTEATDLPGASSNSLRFAEQCGVGFIGEMDNVRYWSVARTPQQVRDAMHKQFTPAEAAAQAGLVGSWTFEGPTPLADGTGQNPVGSLTGQARLEAADLPRPRNHVLVLDSVGEHVVVPHSASLAASEAITVECWLYFRNTSGWGRIGKVAPSDCQWDLSPNSQANQSAFNLHGPPADANGWDLPRNQWTHVAGTWSQADGTTRVYVDGQLVRETVGAQVPMLDRDYPLYIGHLPGYAETQLYGMVDNLRIWTVARSQAEIVAMRDQQLTPTEAAGMPGLAASYSFEDGATDATGRNHGEFVAGAGIKIDDTLLPTNARQWATVAGGNGHWYAIDVRPSAISYSAARVEAERQGGHLASLTSAAENQFVYERSIATPGGWIRLPNWHFGPWIGARRSTPGSPSFIWETGEPFEFTAWMPGGSNCGVTQPDATSQDFVVMSNGCPVDTSPTWSDSENNEGARSLAIEWSADCNGDGVVDYGQIMAGLLLDADRDQIPDCCLSGGPCSPCPPDTDRDGYVDGADVAVVLAAWGTTGSSAADVSGDNFVNGADLGLVLAAWGSRCTD
jgi:hypothetical protein